MKYNGKFDSCQVQKKLETHEYTRFFYIYPLGKLFYKKTIFMHFAVPITIRYCVWYPFNMFFQKYVRR